MDSDIQRSKKKISMVLDGWPTKIIVWFIKFVVLIHDIVTFPIYFLIHKPWHKWMSNEIVWSKLEDENDPYSCYIRQESCGMTFYKDCETLPQLFDNSVAEYGDKKCFGTRKVLGEEEEITESGNVLKKLLLGEYKWMTYNEANARVDIISRGLLSLGIKEKTLVALFAETRVEWMLIAQACFRINARVVTFYATLPESSLKQGINETEVEYIFTSAELLPKLKVILPHLPFVKGIICMDNTPAPKIPDNVEFTVLHAVEELGKTNSDAYFTPPVPEDIALIMYTSGSSGAPKGVMITHKNVISSIKGLTNKYSSKEIKEERNSKHIAYLPLAHILEFASECFYLSSGVQIGFSSPKTLTDFSPAIKLGEKGDLSILKPTVFTAVPLLLDGIKTSILQRAGKEGTFSRQVFDFAINYKTFWSDFGFQTPILDRKLIQKCQDLMGGNLKTIFCGGAPLSVETHNFIRRCFNCDVFLGYGLTETAAATCLQDSGDLSVGRVGAPLSTCRLRLVDWEEGKYFVTDKPNPRGEIVIGGDIISLGYYKKETTTMEFYKIEKGERWFYTGDIGEIFPNGTLKIIDRKKDLVKLQFGEYIALGKVEAEMKTNSLVANICVFGTFLQNYLVALVIPNERELKMIADDLNIDSINFEEMCSNAEIVQKVEEKLKQHARKCQLYGSEIPRKIKLCSDEWTPESGLVTAALKLRRKQVENHYKHIIESMYKENN